MNVTILIIVGCFIIFDIVTGILKAISKEGLNSTILRQGLYHKLSEVLAVVGTGLLELGAKYINFGVELPLFEATAIYICIMEFISIVENLCILNPELGRFFTPYINKLKGGKKDDE